MILKEKVEEVLKEIRPHLRADCGDVQLVGVDEDGTVRVKLLGACGACPMSQMTMKVGIERIIRQKIPQVKEVINV